MFKVTHFLIFLVFKNCFLLPLLFKFYDNGRHIYGLRTSLKAQQLFHFLINFRINTAGVVDPCKVVVRKRAFSTLSTQVHKMKVKTENLKNHEKKRKEKKPKVN